MASEFTLQLKEAALGPTHRVRGFQRGPLPSSAYVAPSWGSEGTAHSLGLPKAPHRARAQQQRRAPAVGRIWGAEGRV